MRTEWDLSKLYEGFDAKYDSDTKELKELVVMFKEAVSSDKTNQVQYIENVLVLEEKIQCLLTSLFSYPSLRQSTNVNDQECPKHLAKISSIARNLTEPQVDFTKFLKGVDLDSLAKKSTLINTYLFILNERKQNSKRMLSKKEEVLYSKMKELASSSWSDLQSLCTANLLIDFRGKKMPLSVIRNLAYEKDSTTRKEAYEAELHGYESIENYVALGLSNIKREVNTIGKLRGYKNALEASLETCRMTKKSLDALISTMRDYRKVFASYLKAKAKYLGYKEGLPFYDMFAPVGKFDKTFSFEDSRAFVLEGYYSYSKKLGDFGKKVFDNAWIDVYPKAGKVGGAFCANLPFLKESRVLTNFTGTLSDCLTLAHELGHAYHGEVMSDNAPLNTDYPMQLAETASIFCETIINNNLLSKITDKEERLAILENSLQDSTQVIIDILSRYIFETNLIKASEGPVSAPEMKELMINAQKEAYLDGLDAKLLHPYMWLCKGHYYSAGFNFYNFPYAFGLLYGKGLYSVYLKDKESFIKKYDDMLALTTHETAENVALSMGIDITKKDFWIGSLDQIKEQVEEVIALFSELKKKK